MKLVDLKPDWKYHGEYKHLAFDCPLCRKHRIEIPVPPHPQAWQITGKTFENFTLSPSIWHNRGKVNPTVCESHFFITKGEIKLV